MAFKIAYLAVEAIHTLLLLLVLVLVVLVLVLLLLLGSLIGGPVDLECGLRDVTEEGISPCSHLIGRRHLSFHCRRGSFRQRTDRLELDLNQPLRPGERHHTALSQSPVSKSIIKTTARSTRSARSIIIGSAIKTATGSGKSVAIGSGRGPCLCGHVLLLLSMKALICRLV